MDFAAINGEVESFAAYVGELTHAYNRMPNAEARKIEEPFVYWRNEPGRSAIHR